VKIELNKALGKDFSLKDLQDMGFGAILLAIGSKPEPVNKELNITDDGFIDVDEGTGLTSIDGVFSAGDAIHAKRRSLIQAVADGKRSAYFIDLFLNKQPLTPLPELKPVSKRSVLVRSIEEPELPRVDISKVDGMERTLTEEEAVREASRCLACGCGVGCGRCQRVCIYSGVDLVGDRYFINEQNCDGCGLCVEICPNEAIEMVSIDG